MVAAETDFPPGVRPRLGRDSLWVGYSDWWPEDEDWCVYSSPDTAWTLVGGPSETIDRILGDNLLEAVQLGRSDPLWRL